MYEPFPIHNSLHDFLHFAPSKSTQFQSTGTHCLTCARPAHLAFVFKTAAPPDNYNHSISHHSSVVQARDACIKWVCQNDRSGGSHAVTGTAESAQRRGDRDVIIWVGVGMCLLQTASSAGLRSAYPVSRPFLVHMDVQARWTAKRNAAARRICIPTQTQTQSKYPRKLVLCA